MIIGVLPMALSLVKVASRMPLGRTVVGGLLPGPWQRWWSCGVFARSWVGGA
jgi:hypothetical protein